MLKQSICTFAIISMIYGSTFGQVLNCSQVLKTKENETNLKRRGNYLHLLYECFKANPYNIKQLPVPLGTAGGQMKVSYIVSIFNLLELSAQGMLVVMADINFRWTDSYRKWNTSQIPVDKIQIPATEVWYPRFTMCNCRGDVCVIRPDDDTFVTISSNGKVSMTVTRKLASDCDVILKYFPLDQQCCKMSFHMYA